MQKCRRKFRDRLTRWGVGEVTEESLMGSQHAMLRDKRSTRYSLSDSRGHWCLSVSLSPRGTKQY